MRYEYGRQKKCGRLPRTMRARGRQCRPPVYLKGKARRRPPAMTDLKRHIRDVPDFPRPGIIFRDIAPLLRTHFGAVIEAMGELLSAAEWARIDAVAG